MKIIFLTFLFLLLSAAVISACPAGQYAVRSKFEYLCYGCSPGTYCPGDDEYYVCGENFHAPWYGMTSCLPCPAERPIGRSPHAYCMPKDTPVKSQYWYSEPNMDRAVNHLLINGTEPTYFHTGLDFSALVLNPMYDGMMVVLSAATEITAYSALKTGAPSEERHDEKRVGTVATFLVSYQDLEKDWAQYSPWYLSLTGAAAKTNITVYVQPANLTTNVLDVGVNNVDADESSVHMFFTFKNDEDGARYNISVVSVDLNPEDRGYCYQYLNMDEADQSQSMPNQYNGKVVAKDVAQHVVSTSYVTTPKQAGNVFFSVLPHCWSQPISMKITITKVSASSNNNHKTKHISITNNK